MWTSKNCRQVEKIQWQFAIPIPENRLDLLRGPRLAKSKSLIIEAAGKMPSCLETHVNSSEVRLALEKLV